MIPEIANFTKILKPCIGCGKGLSDPIYDHFWSKETKIMEYSVTRTVSIEADSAEEALEKTKPAQGKTISIGAVVPRPTTTNVMGQVQK